MAYLFLPLQIFKVEYERVQGFDSVQIVPQPELYTDYTNYAEYHHLDKPSKLSFDVSSKSGLFHEIYPTKNVLIGQSIATNFLPVYPGDNSRLSLNLYEIQSITRQSTDDMKGMIYKVEAISLEVNLQRWPAACPPHMVKHKDFTMWEHLHTMSAYYLNKALCENPNHGDVKRRGGWDQRPNATNIALFTQVGEADPDMNGVRFAPGTIYEIFKSIAAVHNHWFYWIWKPFGNAPGYTGLHGVYLQEIKRRPPHLNSSYIFYEELSSFRVMENNKEEITDGWSLYGDSLKAQENSRRGLTTGERRQMNRKYQFFNHNSVKGDTEAETKKAILERIATAIDDKIPEIVVEADLKTKFYGANQKRLKIGNIYYLIVSKNEVYEMTVKGVSVTKDQEIDNPVVLYEFVGKRIPPMVTDNGDEDCLYYFEQIENEGNYANDDAEAVAVDKTLAETRLEELSS